MYTEHCGDVVMKRFPPDPHFISVKKIIHVQSLLPADCKKITVYM